MGYWTLLIVWFLDDGQVSRVEIKDRYEHQEPCEAYAAYIERSMASTQVYRALCVRLDKRGGTNESTTAH